MWYWKTLTLSPPPVQSHLRSIKIHLDIILMCYTKIMININFMNSSFLLKTFRNVFLMVISNKFISEFQEHSHSNGVWFVKIFSTTSFWLLGQSSSGWEVSPIQGIHTAVSQDINWSGGCLTEMLRLIYSNLLFVIDFKINL